MSQYAITRWRQASLWIGGVALLAMLGALPNVSLAAGANDLVKCEDFAAVYFIGDDGKRYSFPNEKIFFTWHPDFDEVKQISCDDLATLPLGGVVKYRAGVRLIKIPSVPKVYAVEPDGALRPIKDEGQAKELYGEGWSQFVDDLPESFFPRYSVSTELKKGELPEGMILEDEEKLFQVDEDGEVVEVEGVFSERDKSLLRRHAHKVDKLEKRLGRALSKISELEKEIERLQRLLEGGKTVRVDASEHKTVVVKEVKKVVTNTRGNDSGNGQIGSTPTPPAEKALPDLLVKDIFLGDSVTGVGASLSATVVNNGTAAVTQDVTVYFWLDDVLEWTYNTSTWANKDFKQVGGSTTATPQHIEGTRTVKVCIDTRDIVAESNESNNCLTETLEAPEGDFELTVGSVDALDALGHADETMRSFGFNTTGPLDHFRIRIWDASGALHDEFVQQVIGNTTTKAWYVSPSWLSPLALGKKYTYEIHAEEYMTGDADTKTGSFTTAAAAVTAGPVLELSVNPQPPYAEVRGADDAFLGQFTFSNSSADTIEITELAFQLVGDNDGNPTPVNEGINVQNHISSCWAKSGSVMMSSVEGVGSNGFVTLDNLNWGAASNSTFSFNLYCSLTLTATEGGDVDLYLARVNDVDAVDARYASTANDLTAAEKSLDSTGALNSDAQHYIQVLDEGILLFQLDGSSPAGAVALQPSALNVMGVFKVAATYENIEVDQVAFYVKAASTVNSVVIEYQDAAGNTVTQTGFPVGGYVTFSGADIFVEDSNWNLVTVSLELGAVITAGDEYRVTMNPTGYPVSAVGLTSGSAVTPSSSSFDVTGNTVVAL